MNRATAAAAIVCVLAAWSAPTVAHEVRPAYLELVESSPGQVDVVWKLPLREGMVLDLQPQLPPSCEPLTDRRAENTGEAWIERWTTSCDLRSGAIGVLGLQRTMIDALVRVDLLEEAQIHRLLRPESPSFEIDSQQHGTGTYLRLGIEHLLLGFDHILFVIGLLFLVRRPMQLLAVITAFTVAHSITLGLSTVGLVRLSQAPVEAAIALSILYLACELLRPPDQRSETTTRFPWTVAFAFGLLHGFGFAGALTEIGLPRGNLAGALFLFNLGVEIGQLLVVGVILGLLWTGRKLMPTGASMPVAILHAPIWAMGTISAYWLVERTAGLL